MTVDLLRTVRESLGSAGAAPDVFLSVTHERAREEAASAMARRERGTVRGPLDGATISWKDMIALSGVVLTAGSRTRIGRAAETADAPLVARGAAAGLITIGTTNLTEFAFSGIGQNPHFGTPLFDGKVPGGSSSGAAASVRRGIVRLAVGTDTAGSCRVPAAFQGLFGFRPTRGRYPMEGVLPLAPAYDTAGLITGTARDLRDLDAIMAGDASIPDQPIEIVLDQHATDQADLPIAQAIRQTLNGAMARFPFREATHTVLSTAVALIEEHGWPGAVDAARTHADLMSSDLFELVDPLVAARLRTSAAQDSRALDHVRDVAAGLRASLPQPNLVIALPTVAVAAPEAELLLSDPSAYAEMNARILRLTMAASLLDLPAATLPVALTQRGAWCGLQLVGTPGSDRALLTLACELEAILPIQGQVA